MKVRFYIGCALVGIGMIAFYTGCFSAQRDIHLGALGIPAIYFLGTGISVMLVGLIVLPNRRARAGLLK